MTETEAEEAAAEEAEATQEAAATTAAEATSSGANDHLLRYTNLGKLLEAARLGEVKFLDAKFLIAWHEAGRGKLLRRQEMEPLGAFLPAEALTEEQAAAGKLELVALSYCWASREHPDPDVFHLRRVVAAAKAFFAGRKPSDEEALYKEGFTTLTNYGLEAAGYTFGASHPDTKLGIFWDYGSLPQKEFADEEEKRLFKRGLQNINAIYGHQRVTKLVMPELPPGASRRPYDESGWTRFEAEVANLTSPPHRLLRLDSEFAKDLFKRQEQDPTCEMPADSWIKLVLAGGKLIQRTGPRLPQEFEEELQQLHFTNGADQSLVAAKYAEAFNHIVSHATEYNANSFDLSGETARRVLEVLQGHCQPQELRALDLGNNKKMDFVLEEMAEQLGRFKGLQQLKLSVCKQLRGAVAAIAEGFPELKVLDLAGCTEVTVDLKDLAQLSKLERLDLNRCEQVTGDLKSFSGLTLMQDLNLTDCAALQGDVKALAPLTGLRILSLHGCEQVTGNLKSFSGLTLMQDLDLTNCAALQGDVKALSPLKDLQILHLYACHQVRGELSSFCNLTRLQELYLADCADVTGDVKDMSPLKELQHLVLQGCSQVTGNLISFSDLTRLQVLSLARCGQVEGDIKALSPLTELQKLSLEGCSQVTGNLSSLSGLTQMDFLVLNDCSNVYGRVEQEGVEIRGYDNRRPRPVPYTDTPFATPPAADHKKSSIEARSPTQSPVAVVTSLADAPQAFSGGCESACSGLQHHDPIPEAGSSVPSQGERQQEQELLGPPSSTASASRSALQIAAAAAVRSSQKGENGSEAGEQTPAVKLGAGSEPAVEEEIQEKAQKQGDDAAILGSRLPAANIENQDLVLRVFHKWDVEDKGCIGASDWRQVLAQLDPEASLADIDEMYKLTNPGNESTVRYTDVLGILYHQEPTTAMPDAAPSRGVPVE